MRLTRVRGRTEERFGYLSGQIPAIHQTENITTALSTVCMTISRHIEKRLVRCVGAVGDVEGEKRGTLGPDASLRGTL